MIMLILIGTVPTGYELKSRHAGSASGAFPEDKAAAPPLIAAKGAVTAIIGDPRPAVTQYVASIRSARGHPSIAVW